MNQIEGVIRIVLPIKSGTDKNGKAWSLQEYVIETDERYPKKVCFSVFGEDTIKEFNLQVGTQCRVSVDIDAHAFGERWYNSIRAYRVERLGAEAIPPTQTAEVFPPKQAVKPNDDLPF